MPDLVVDLEVLLDLEGGDLLEHLGLLELHEVVDDEVGRPEVADQRGGHRLLAPARPVHRGVENHPGLLPEELVGKPDADLLCG